MILFPNKIVHPDRKKLGKILMDLHPKTTSVWKARHYRGERAEVLSESLPPLWMPQGSHTVVLSRKLSEHGYQHHLELNQSY